MGVGGHWKTLSFFSQLRQLQALPVLLILARHKNKRRERKDGGTRLQAEQSGGPTTGNALFQTLARR